MARAADVQVTPTLIDLTAAGPRATLALRNGGAEPVRLEVTARRWAQGSDGSMQLSPAADCVVYPPILVLGPGETRNLRVGTTAKAGPAERSWRVFLEELPPPERPGGPAQVRVLSRISIPVFLAPERAVVRSEVTGLALEGGRARFALRNTGTVHLRPVEVRLEGRDAGGSAVLARAVEAWYLLAGGERDLEVALPAAECRKLATLAVEAVFDRDHAVARSRVAVPAGACGP